MKSLILFLFPILFLSNQAYSQIALETQIGGANFVGITINSRIKIPLNNMRFQSLSATIGVGILAPWWDQPTAIINGGITYNYKSWGIGTEISVFKDNPFVPSSGPRDFADMIIYPNLNYTCKITPRWYLRLSAGSYFAFTKSASSISTKDKLGFKGDVIPGAGVGIGYFIGR